MCGKYVENMRHPNRYNPIQNPNDEETVNMVLENSKQHYLAEIRRESELHAVMDKSRREYEEVLERELQVVMDASSRDYERGGVGLHSRLVNKYRREYGIYSPLSRHLQEAMVKESVGSHNSWEGGTQISSNGDKQTKEYTVSLLQPICGDHNKIPIKVFSNGQLQHAREAPLEKKIQIQYYNGITYSLISEWFSIVKTLADGNCLFHALCMGMWGQGSVWIWPDPLQLRKGICANLTDKPKLFTLLDKIPIERYKLSYGENGYRTVLGTFTDVDNNTVENWQDDILNCICKDQQYNCELFDDLLVIMAVFIGYDIICISQPRRGNPIWSVYFASQIPTEKMIVVYHESDHYSAVLRTDS